MPCPHLASLPRLPINMEEEFSRTTRSRSNSITLEGSASILDFSKPVTLDSPGCYRLSNSESGCTISLFYDVLPKTHCDAMVTELESLGTLKQYTTLHKNQNHPLPRLSAWFGPIDYAYSGVVMKGNAVSDSPSVVAAYHHLANNVLDPNNIATTADCFLVNKYRNGRDSCGEHSDDEPEVDRFSPIVTLSLGQQRFMLIRELGKQGNAIAVKLEPGSVLVMNGDNFQGKYTHQIPKDNVCNSPRTSITFRTCNHEYLASRNALSTPLVAIHSAQPVCSTLKSQQVMTSSPTPPPSQDSKRRQSLGFSSLSLSGVKFDTSTDLASPTTPSSPLTGNISENSSKASSEGEFPPLSLEVMSEAIDAIKERSVKLELSRYSLPTSGSSIDCRKRLKKAVKASFQKLASNLLHRSTIPDQPEPNYISNAIEMLEKSIIDLQAKISTQNSVLQTLVLCNEDSKSKVSSNADAIPKEISNFDKRLEKIEELIDSIKEEQTENTNLFNKLEANVDIIQSNTTETKERVRSGLQPPKNRPPRNRQDRPASSQPQNRNQTGRKKRKVLILHDSQLNAFEPASFSQAFDVEKYKAGSYTDLASKHMRQVISKPSIDAYVLQLGVNDYRYQSTPASLEKAVDDTKACISKLLASSKAKVVVTLPTPTPNDGICDRTKDYVRLVTEFITSTRQSDNNWKRLYTVNNLASFNNALEKLGSSPDSPDPLQPDRLHVSEYGLKKLSLNIKHGLYRSFGLKVPRRQAPAEP